MMNLFLAANRYPRGGIREAIARNKSELLALGAGGVLGHAGQMGDLPVGKSERFGFG